MPSKLKTIFSSDMSIKDMSLSFLSVLDIDVVIIKLASIRSASISLTFDEKMISVMNKLDSIANDNEMQKRLLVIEKKNAKLKQKNSTLQISVCFLSLKVNQMEQLSRKNNIVITGVIKTFVERTSDATAENEAAHQSS